MIYPYRCQICEVVVEIERSVHAPSDPPGTDYKCLCEQPTWKRVYEMPGTLKESYLDGTKRFTDMKEAAKLNKEALRSSSNQKRDEIKAEIRKLGVRVSRE